MNNSIETYEDLLVEKARLEAVMNGHKAYIKKDMQIILDELDPFKNALTAVKKLFTRGDKSGNPLVTMGINLAGDLVLKKFLLARAGWMAKLIVPYLVKNYSSHLISKNLFNLSLNSRTNGNGNYQQSNFLQRFGEKLKSSAVQKNGG